MKLKDAFLKATSPAVVCIANASVYSAVKILQEINTYHFRVFQHFPLHTGAFVKSYGADISGAIWPAVLFRIALAPESDFNEDAPIPAWKSATIAMTGLTAWELLKLPARHFDWGNMLAYSASLATWCALDAVRCKVAESRDERIEERSDPRLSASPG